MLRWHCLVRLGAVFEEFYLHDATEASLHAWKVLAFPTTHFQLGALENTMAKKSERGVKTQAVRDYLNAHKKAKATEVVAALKEKGIEVSTGMVYNLKARRTMGKRRRKAEASGETIGPSITHLLAAKKLVQETGGVKQAQEALAALAKLI
jgi:hypothetical protein